jgi:ribA/ribD-fused uncharacterized protein
MQPHTPKIIFNEVGVDGVSSYQRGDWQKIAVHGPGEIRGFFGPFRWLSNAEPCDVVYEGMTFPSSENAYQAAKFPLLARRTFQGCSPIGAIRLSERLSMEDPETWSQRRVDVMRTVLLSKFGDNPVLREKLFATDDAYLEERLWWRDTFWGFDVNLNRGENQLGHLLMEVRRSLGQSHGAPDGAFSELKLPSHW